MKLTGKNLIAGQWLGEVGQNTFNAYQPATNDYGQQYFFSATSKQLERAVEEAQRAFIDYRKTSAGQRAEFLRSIAEHILELGDELLQLTHIETGLPLARLQSERQRTINQLNAFSHELLFPSSTDIKEAGDADREPLPKPATVLTWIPLGPTAVFGASNFPYAFSTLGGDTASALASGCPVVVKAHPAHPGTSELMARAILQAIEKTNMPIGVFSQLHSPEPELSHLLVKQPAIRAVGFTGSKKVADLLQKSIQQRDDPIPFYGELGSINPQFILAEKAQQHGAALAEQFCQAMLMGNGQFCTSPGVWCVPQDASCFLESCKNYICLQNSDTLLTKGIQAEYQATVITLMMDELVQNFATAKKDKNFHAASTLFLTSSNDFINNVQLRQEIFGPCAVIVTYSHKSELKQIVDVLDGQLTASVHGTDGDFQQHSECIEALKYKVGRLIYNQMPTGVEVCASMNHGGPYPASTDIRSSSVGLQAMKRFVRPLCIQNGPD